MLPANRNPSPPHQVAQHPAPGERIIKVQRVDLAHDRKIGRRNRAWLIINAPAADLQHLRLARDR